MNRNGWPAPVIEQKVFAVGDTVRILPSRNPKNKNDPITWHFGTVMSGLRKQTNPQSTKYIGYEINVDGHRDSLNSAGYCLVPAYRLEHAHRPSDMIGKIAGRIACAIGSHDMVWGFGSPVPGHCARGCGHQEVDAD